jgi:hypothetical protein
LFIAHITCVSHSLIISLFPCEDKFYLIEIGNLYGRNDLIEIGTKPDDGIIYTAEMFDTNPLIEDIGEYVSTSFTEGIKYTLENY